MEMTVSALTYYEIPVILSLVQKKENSAKAFISKVKHLVNSTLQDFLPESLQKRETIKYSYFKVSILL